MKINYSFAFEIYSDTFSEFYRKILESDNLEYFDWDKFIQKNNFKGITTLIQMQMKNMLRPFKLSVYTYFNKDIF